MAVASPTGHFCHAPLLLLALGVFGLVVGIRWARGSWSGHSAHRSARCHAGDRLLASSAVVGRTPPQDRFRAVRLGVVVLVHGPAEQSLRHLPGPRSDAPGGARSWRDAVAIAWSIGFSLLFSDLVLQRGRELAHGLIPRFGLAIGAVEAGVRLVARPGSTRLHAHVPDDDPCASGNGRSCWRVWSPRWFLGTAYVANIYHGTVRRPPGRCRGGGRAAPAGVHAVDGCADGGR